MAAQLSHRSDRIASQSSDALLRSLANVLPEGYRFGVFHLSTPPTRTEPLCSAPPHERPDRTFCEKHFLAITVNYFICPSDGVRGVELSGRVIVLALEVFIFTTAFSSTFFVSKADSTGYLPLLGLPKGAPSPIRSITSAFLSYLVEQRRRKDVQCVVSLFARAQSQYLFPRSVENKDKHVLDDRGLVRWWCRVLNTLVESPPQGSLPGWRRVKAYLVVPGLDDYETRALIPRTSKNADRWVLGDPLRLISHYSKEFDWVPARCLIPRFPDDPKARFRDELDEEAAKSKLMQTTGSWKSVKSLDQFWEMMAYRQECSSGRMTGFIWVVMDAIDKEDPISSMQSGQTTSQYSTTEPTTPAEELPSTPSKQKQGRDTLTLTTPKKLFPTSSSKALAEDGADGDHKRKAEKKSRKRKKKLRGPIRVHQPRVKTHQRNYLLDKPVSSPYYYWPAEGRGRRIVDEPAYKRSLELLLQLDFSTLELATKSTIRWDRDVGMGEAWMLELEGKQALEVLTDVTSNGIPNNLSGLIKRKRSDTTAENGNKGGENGVNVLGTGLVRKKPKA